MTTVNLLRADGHDVTHLREQGLITLPDAQIVEKAKNERRVIVTLDLDFGTLLAKSGQVLPSVVIVRLHDETPQSISPKLLEALKIHDVELDAGAIVIVEDGRHRIRRLPVDSADQA